MSVAIWTDSDERIVQRHFKPDEIDTSSANVVIDNIPDEPDNPPWVENRAFYNDVDGVYYVSEDPFDGLQLSKSQKRELYNAIISTDLVKAREIVETALKS